MAENPIERIYMYSFSSSIRVPSFEGYSHVLIFIDNATGYLWLYG
jgi:hypothetical protein